MAAIEQGDVRIDQERIMQILSLDLYPEVTVFARELLQNADDAEAPRLSFLVKESELLVENSGKEFDEKDVERITSFGFGKEDPELIGTFGIGFRSVYRITDRPKIVSGSREIYFPALFHYEIRQLVEPRSGSLITLPFRHLSQADLDGIHNDLPGSVTEMMLFIRHLKEVLVEDTPKGRNWSVFRIPGKPEEVVPAIQSYHLEIRESENKQEKIQRWITFHKRVDTASISRGLTLRKVPKDASVSTAFRVDDSGNCLRSRGVLYAMLPTNINTGFGFDINAKFMTDASRSGIRADGDAGEWNNRLIQEMASLVSVSVKKLAADTARASWTNDSFNGLYETLWVEAAQIDRHPSLRRLHDELREVLLNERIVATTTGQLANHTEAFFAEKELQELLGDQFRYVYAGTSKTARELLESIGVGRKTAVDLVEQLLHLGTTSEKSSGWFVKAFGFLYRNKDQIKETAERLKAAKIILTENGNLRTPKEAFLPIRGQGDEVITLEVDDFVHHEITANEEASRFLREVLGMREPDANDTIGRFLLPKYSMFDDHKKRDALAFIVKNLYKNRDRLEATVQDAIRQAPIVKAKDGSYQVGNTLYLRTKELTLALGAEANFISGEYDDDEYWKSLPYWREVFANYVGVSTIPTPNDLVDRLLTTARQTNPEQASNTIGNLVKYLEAHFDFYSNKPDIQRLLNEEWIPTSRGYRKPSDTYVDLEDVKEVVGADAPFVMLAGRYPRTETFLGIRSKPTPQDAAKRLVQLCSARNGSDTKLFEKLYRILAEGFFKLSPETQEALKRNAVVLILQTGQFLKGEDTYLNDYSHLFGQYRGFIRQYPPECISFFYSVGAKPSPSSDDMARFLMEVGTQKYQLATSNVIKLYETLGPMYAYVSVPLRMVLATSRVILSDSGEFCYPSEVFIADNEKLKTSFVSSVKFAITSDLALPFLEMVGVQRLSKSVIMQPSAEPPLTINEDCSALGRVVEQLVPILKRLHLGGKFADGWNDRLNEVSIRSSRKIEVVYSIPGKATVKEEDTAAYFPDGNTFVLTKFGGNVPAIARELGYLVRLVKDSDTTLLSSILANVMADPSRGLDTLAELGIQLAPELELGLPEIKELPAGEVEPMLKEEHEAVDTGVFVSPPSQSMPNAGALKDAFPDEEEIRFIDQASEEPERGIRDVIHHFTKEEGEPVERRIRRPKREIPSVEMPLSVRRYVGFEIAAPKSWKPRNVGDETVYVNDGMEPPSQEEIAKFKVLIRKIVEIMGGEPDTVNVCVTNQLTDGYNEDGQLFFNVTRKDSPLRWIVVVARELARNDKPVYWYKQIKIMAELIPLAISRLDEISPDTVNEFYRRRRN